MGGDHALVGAEGGKHFGAVAARVECDVMLQVVDRVVGGADGADVEVFTDVLCGKCRFGDFGVGQLPDGVCGFGAEDEVCVEVAF